MADSWPRSRSVESQAAMPHPPLPDPPVVQSKAGLSTTAAMEHSTAIGYTSQVSSSVAVLPRKRRGDSPLKSRRRWFVQNQIGGFGVWPVLLVPLFTLTWAGAWCLVPGLSVNLLALLFLTHICIPKARTHTRKFFSLSYHNPTSGRYAIGLDDGYFVSFVFTLLILLRASLMSYVLEPLGRRGGITKPNKLTRFSEQSWTMMAYLVLWIFGLCAWSEAKTFLNGRIDFNDWPNREETMFKTYLLIQVSSCFHMTLLLHIEEPRKDHGQMLTHHIITAFLMIGSYFYHFTKIGNLIMILMDPADILLSLAKCMKYTGFTTLCDATFVIFMLTWFVCRHVIFPIVWFALLSWRQHFSKLACYHGPQGNLVGPIPPPPGYRHHVDPFINPTGYVCFGPPFCYSLMAGLALLQVIMFVWFVMIVRVAIRVIHGDGAVDSRTDDEGEEIDHESEEIDDDEADREDGRPFAQEVCADEIDFKSWEKRAGLKRQAMSSAVALPGHSGKELLGRIGCDKHIE